MRLVTPYETAAALIRDLDNGGRWFNFFTAKSDGVVFASELKKAAGAWTLATASLYLDLAAVALGAADRAELERALDPVLKARLLPPVWLPPEGLAAASRQGWSVVTSGRLRFVETTSVTTYTTTTTSDGEGNSTVSVTPQTTEYSLYQLVDPDGDGAALLALPADPRLGDGRIRLAGPLQRLVVDDHGREEIYLELKFYTPLEGRPSYAAGEGWLTSALRHRVS